MISIMLLGVFAFATRSQSAEPLRVFLLDPNVLVHERQLAQSHPDKPDRVFQVAIADADKAMSAGPFSVMQKSAVPPSGDKHDYMSLAPYFWPNPDTANHLPYVRHDGERNPEIKQITDHDELGKMCSAVHALALGFYLSGKEEYAGRAALLLKTWFLDSATRMNPNLEFAQGIRGVNTGRGIGIIETRGLEDAVDTVGLLAESKSWTEADDRALKRWFGSYLEWLRTSPHGKDESHSKNNHGSFYDDQVVDFALFTDRRDIATDVAKAAGEKRIAVQIQPDGKEPLELARTKSFSYSTFNLRALTELATLSKQVDVDLWRFQTTDGRSIRQALDFLLPYASGEKPWPYKEIDGLHPADLAGPLLQAAIVYKDPKYKQAGMQLAGARPNLNALLLEAALEGN